MLDFAKNLSITPRSVTPTKHSARSIKKIHIELPKIRYTRSKPIEISIYKPNKKEFTPLNLTPPRTFSKPLPSLLTKELKTEKKHSAKKSFFEIIFPE